ncbi:MAG: ATP-binding protein [Gammaproteobacteria bacterium]
MKRAQLDIICKDLQKKMVFIIGPRQVGKTWLARKIAENFNSTAYLNYDSRQDREIILNENWLPDTDLLILDELHKMPDWKNYIKGVYDTKPRNLKILVTGSARLNVYKNLGDSLAGRFFAHRLLPFSPAELTKIKQVMDLDHLLARGGFPEPFLAEEDVDADRWRMQYIDDLIRTDVLDFENINNLKALQLTLELLRERVGSPVSFKSIAEDIGVSPNTIKKYIQIFEALYIVFKVTPYHKNIARSLLKEPKIYFYDVGMVKGAEAARFENLIAVSLLKYVYAKIDIMAEHYALHYLRTKDGREVDFALVKDGQIAQLIEAKLTNNSLSKDLYFFVKKYNLPAVQLVKNLKNACVKEGVEIKHARKYLCDLMM